jgi:hypothetical protein
MFISVVIFLMRRPDFGDVLKIGSFFSDVKGPLRTTRVQIPTYILWYFTGHRWGAPEVY